LRGKCVYVCVWGGGRGGGCWVCGSSSYGVSCFLGCVVCQVDVLGHGPQGEHQAGRGHCQDSGGRQCVRGVSKRRGGGGAFVAYPSPLPLPCTPPSPACGPLLAPWSQHDPLPACCRPPCTVRVVYPGVAVLFACAGAYPGPAEGAGPDKQRKKVRGDVRASWLRLEAAHRREARPGTAPVPAGAGTDVCVPRCTTSRRRLVLLPCGGLVRGTSCGHAGR
jgi:hypothetical protein